MGITMAKEENCTFCDTDKVGENRIIYNEDPDYYSFISTPWFRPDHCLVVPRVHAIEMYDIPDSVLGKMLGEAALLGHAMDEGYGTVITQKFQPMATEGKIKQNHVHVHVWRRLETDTEATPFPVPTSLREDDPSGFRWPADDEAIESCERMRTLALSMRKARRVRPKS